MADLVWIPAWNASFGLATPPAEPAVDWIYVEDGHLMRRGQRFRIYGTATTGTGCGLDDADERTGLPLRIAANGHNVVRMMGWQVGFYDGTNSLGLWKHLPWQANTKITSSEHCSYGGNLYKQTSGSTTGSTPPTHTVGSASDGGVTWAYQGAAPASYYDETFLTRMDETIANLNARGIYVWLGFDHGGMIRRAQGMRYSTRVSTASSPDQGMQWSTEWMESAKKVELSMMLNRVNTVTGVRYCDNPGIMCWQTFNEDAMGQTFMSGYMDDLITPLDATAGYWKTELDEKLNAWADGEGWALPAAWAGGFPTKALWSAASTADQTNLLEFIYYCDFNCASDLRNWLRSHNPNLLLCYSEHNYCDTRVHLAADLTSIHRYAGSSNATGNSYTTRKSMLADNANGDPWGQVDTYRHPDRPRITTEVGNYGLTRFDWETALVHTVVVSLQDQDGLCLFNEGQNRWQNLIVGIQSTHYHACWPSRRLAALCAAPMMKYNFIGKLPDATTFTVDPDGVAAKAQSIGRVAAGGYNYTSGNDGSEWEFLGRRVYTQFGTPQVVTNYNSIKDANITAGITITTDKGTLTWKGNAAAAPLLSVNVPAACGWSGIVDNATVGSMQISGIGAAFPGLVFIRSQGNFPLYRGDALLFIHQYSRVTDAAGFTGASDSEAVTSWGTEANTVLVVPAAFTVALTSPVDLVIEGVGADGSLNAIVSSYVGGVVSFTSSTSYPLYKVTPKQPASRAKARR